MQAKASPRRLRVKRHPGVYYRETSSGRHYEITYYDSDGRRRWERVPGSLEDAVARRADIVGKKHRGDRVAPSTLRFAEFANAWLDVQTNLRPRTKTEYERQIRLHLIPRLGKLKIQDINEDHIATLLARMQKAGYAAWTIKGVLTPLSRILGHAARRGVIPQNPVRRLEAGERPRVEQHAKRILSSDEIRLLFSHAKHYRALLATALFTGLRLSEVLGLRWQDVDFKRAEIHVRKQLGRDGKLAPPKTPQATRDVILMPALAAALELHRKSSEHKADSDYLFATRNGTPLSHRNVQRSALDLVVQRAKLQGTPKLRFHDLRHTFASILIAEGANVVFVSRQLGHANPAITLSVYAHEFARAEHATRVVTALERGYGHLLTAAASESDANTARHPRAA